MQQAAWHLTSIVIDFLSEEGNFFFWSSCSTLCGSPSKSCIHCTVKGLSYWWYGMWHHHSVDMSPFTWVSLPFHLLFVPNFVAQRFSFASRYALLPVPFRSLLICFPIRELGLWACRALHCVRRINLLEKSLKVKVRWRKSTKLQREGEDCGGCGCPFKRGGCLSIYSCRAKWMEPHAVTYSCVPPPLPLPARLRSQY